MSLLVLREQTPTLVSEVNNDFAIDSIFELFHRGEAAKKRFPRGTGMGLYIVKDIMKAHGGDCYVSHSENPTEFAIILPDKEKNENN